MAQTLPPPQRPAAPETSTSEEGMAQPAASELTAAPASEASQYTAAEKIRRGSMEFQEVPSNQTEEEKRQTFMQVPQLS